jgi:hypothetical protein
VDVSEAMDYCVEGLDGGLRVGVEEVGLVIRFIVG